MCSSEGDTVQEAKNRLFRSDQKMELLILLVIN